jgi:phosphoglycerate dehydrogenase-like enzyme/predicted dehydrogenase
MSEPAAAAARPVRALVIGAGPAADHLHLPVLARLRDHGEMELVKICDIQRERASAAGRKFRFAAESGDALGVIEKEDVDAVYVFGSAQMHYEYGLAALRNGRHLFVEKPLAPTYAQALELAQAARARGLVAVVGHNRRFYKSLAALRAHAGRTRWRFAEAVFHKPETGKPVPYGARTWLTANGIHALDALIFMMGGLPEQLDAVAGDGAAPHAHTFSALMRWSDGAQGMFLCNNNAGSRREEYVFHAPGETCTVTAAGLKIEKDGTPHVLSSPATSDGFAAEHEAFIHAIRGAHAPAHAIEAVAPSLFLAELIEAGFRGRVELPQPRPALAAARTIGSSSILVVKPEGFQSALAELIPNHRLVTLEDLRESAGSRADIVGAILGNGAEPFAQDELARMPGLRVVGVVGLSLARYGADELLARNVTLVNASEAYAESVAEFALGVAILGRRRAFLSHEIMRRGGWGTDRRGFGFAGFSRRLFGRLRPVLKSAGLESMFLRTVRAARPAVQRSGSDKRPALELRGATVGLIGWGSNARAFTSRLLTAGARVLVYSEHAKESDIRGTGAVAASLAEVLASDIVSLHRGLNSQTRHALGATELDRLRPGALLINVARGALIQPDALLARLKRGDVFACLDTFEVEPLNGSHALRALPNVFLTSHIAGGSPDMHRHAAEEVVRKVAANLEANAVQHVSPDRLRNMT